jgi:hypothetical protein
VTNELPNADCRLPNEPFLGARRKMALLQREADRIAVLILSTDLPEIDIVIQVERLRERCEELFPGRGDLFEMIYASRFERLREQFGADRRESD